VDVLGIDCGYMTDTVLRAVSTIRLPLRVVAVRGRDAKSYRPQKSAAKVGDNWHLADWANGRVMVINADHWREQYQRAFLLTPGTAGAIALTGRPRDNGRLADEICAERLIERVTTARGDYFQWHCVPGVGNDLLDAGTYALALASAAGASSANAETAWRAVAPVGAPHTNETRRPSRVCRVPIAY
jgi:phage terminase large subunit GpA-like protein